MKQIKFNSSLIYSVFLVLFLFSRSKINEKTVNPNPNIQEVAKEIMTNTYTNALITIDTLNRKYNCAVYNTNIGVVNKLLKID